jgi:hypothetical protein
MAREDKVGSFGIVTLIIKWQQLHLYAHRKPHSDKRGPNVFLRLNHKAAAVLQFYASTGGNIFYDHHSALPK